MKHMDPPADDLRERFILWLAGKPRDQRYNWGNSAKCACGSFIREELSERVTPYRWFPWFTKDVKFDQLAVNEVWYRWNTLAKDCGTYGVLLDKVRDGQGRV